MLISRLVKYPHHEIIKYNRQFIFAIGENSLQRQSILQSTIKVDHFFFDVFVNKIKLVLLFKDFFLS
jgi:hypothetical protein